MQLFPSLQVNSIVDLIYEYLPSIVITLANFITPILFSVIISYEDYSPAFEIRFTLMRCSGFINPLDLSWKELPAVSKLHLLSAGVSSCG